MNIKNKLIIGIAGALLATTGVSTVQESKASAAKYQYRNYSVSPQENLQDLLDSRHYYVKWAKETGSSYYQNKLKNILSYADKKKNAKNEVVVLTAINKVSSIYNEVFEVHLQSEAGQVELSKKKHQLNGLISQAQSYLTESHLSVNQDEAQLKTSVARAQSLLAGSYATYELDNAITELKQRIQSVDDYKNL
ncbi:complement inhibitor SCIN family protein [Staphylococcus durrellii]|uniref:complement inhibitor SCIN family protein n=1 Tax=Staphylococcus durrellii TaxID=2781773 RepID=UPI00189D3068|nr:complement inhibitor SCIN family protein [Staphylococcus durrellii]MBF7018052.1 complement inhibitor SCIN family protein [Staphylococcus durrellii]